MSSVYLWSRPLRYMVCWRRVLLEKWMDRVRSSTGSTMFHPTHICKALHRCRDLASLSDIPFAVAFYVVTSTSMICKSFWYILIYIFQLLLFVVLWLILYNWFRCSQCSCHDLPGDWARCHEGKFWESAAAWLPIEEIGEMFEIIIDWGRFLVCSMFVICATLRSPQSQPWHPFQCCPYHADDGWGHRVDPKGPMTFG